MANGRLPRVPRSLKPDLEQVNSLLQDISTKLSNMPKLEETFRVKTTPLDDIARRFDSILQINKKLGENLISRERTQKSIMDQQRQAGAQLQDHLTTYHRLRQLQNQGVTLTARQNQTLIATGRAIQDLQAHQAELDEQLDSIDSKWAVIGKTIGNQVLGAVDKVGKAILLWSIDAVFASFDMIKTGLLKIYDLFERTTKAVGAFNLALGGTTKGLDSTRKEAFKVEGQLRSLTGGELGVGLKMWQETSQAIGFVGGDFDKMATKATLAGRALGIGGTAAGELTRTFSLMGDTSGDVNRNLVSISDAANDAGVSMADFGKEVNASRGFMASFGKAGKKVFLDSAAFAKKLGVSLKSLEAFTDLTDTFDSTATAAAKMNTVFGTSVNSLELMLEQDPSKRMEMVRQQMFDQGKTFESLTRQERKFFGETFKLSEEEVAAVLKQGMTLDDFHKQQEKNKKKQASDEAKIRKGLAMTAETLFNFKQAWDGVTKALLPLLKKFTDFLGLTAVLDEKGKRINMTFGERMKAIFGRIHEFIDKLGKNKGIQKFLDLISGGMGNVMDMLTKDGPEAGKAMDSVVSVIGEFAEKVTPVIKMVTDFLGITEELDENGKRVNKTMGKNIESLAGFFKSVVKWAPVILKVWAGLKIFGVGKAVFGGIKGAIDMLGGAGTFAKGMKAFGSTLVKFGSSLGDMVASAGRSIAAAASSAASAVGRAAMAIGRAGAWIAGPAVAGAVGYAIGTAVNNITIGGKSVSDILVDSALAFKENVVIMVEDAWEGIKRVIAGMADKVGLSNLLPDFLKPETFERILADVGGFGSDEIKKSIKEQIQKAGRGELSEKEISALGTRLSTARGAQLTRLIEQAGVKDATGLAGKLRGASTIKGYAQEAQDPYLAAVKAGVKGIDLDKGLGFNAKGFGKDITAPVNLAKNVAVTVSEKAGEAKAGFTEEVTAADAKRNFAERRAAKEAAAGAGITMVAGDVYLDGNLVGRHLLRGAAVNGG